MPCKVLILFAHPSQHRSEVNLPLARVSRSLENVTLVDLYAEYPDYCIDIERERAVELAASIKHRYPHLAVLARAFDQIHYYQLKQAPRVTRRTSPKPRTRKTDFDLVDFSQCL
jgi:hypothetical protein